MSLHLSQDKVVLSKSDQNLAVKLTLQETVLDQVDNQDQSRLDMFCVIDVSASMSGERMDTVKKSLCCCLEMLKPTDRMAIVFFTDYAQVLMAPKLVGKNQEMIKATIQNMKTLSSTNISAGLERCFQLILDRKTKNEVTGVFLLSDGQDNCYFQDHSKINVFYDKWSKEMKNEDFTVHTFGYGNNHDDDLMNKIAKKWNGNFYYVKDLDTIFDVFVDCMGGLLSVVGEGGEISLKLKTSKLFPKIRFQRTFGTAFHGDNETERQIRVGNLVKGYSKDFMFEITLNGVKNPNALSDKEKKELLSLVLAKFEVKNLDGAKFEVVEELKTPVFNEQDINDDFRVEKNEEVHKNLLRVTAAEAMNEAQFHADEGNYDGGAGVLDKMCKDLEDYQDDPLFKKMSDNMAIQKTMIKNEKEGIYNDMNRGAYTKNMMNHYMEQEAAPQFCEDAMYENNTKCAMKSVLRSKKANW